MSRLDAKLAIENLEDELQMSLLDSRATRLDIASNIIVNERVKNYLDLLDYASHYTKLVQPNSIYFRNTLRELCLYDKIAEMKAKRQPIPQEYEGKNILRAELRYTSRLATQLKKEVTAQDLYQEDFYLGIFKEWQKQMLQIRTRKELAPTIKKMTTEQFKNYLLAIYIEEQGLDNVLKMVDNNKGNFTNDKAYKRTKESLKNTRHLTEDNNLMKEFEDKIRTMSN